MSVIPFDLHESQDLRFAVSVCPAATTGESWSDDAVRCRPSHV